MTFHSLILSSRGPLIVVAPHHHKNLCLLIAIAKPCLPSPCDSLRRMRPCNDAVTPEVGPLKKCTINFTSLPTVTACAVFKYTPEELMLSTTPVTLNGKAPESTPQMRAGNGSLIRALSRRSWLRAPKSTSSPSAISSSMCRSSEFCSFSTIFCTDDDGVDLTVHS